jgi:hypothetical protein
MLRLHGMKVKCLTTEGLTDVWILSTTITDERVRRAGYIFFSDYYLKIAPVN